MESITSYAPFLLAIPSVLLALSVFLMLLAKKENRLLSRQLTEMTRCLEKTRKEHAELQGKQSKITEFQSSLQLAELTTRLQKPRLEVQRTDADASTPKKYRYFQSLVQKGMAVEDIASVLAISSHEARQLVSLAKIGRGGASQNVVA